jgi:hypothetical protein
MSAADATVHGSEAAGQAIQKNAAHVTLPGIGEIALPDPQRLAWLGGIAILVAVGLVEWPVALVLSLGHLLSESHHNHIVRDFGTALEEA